MPFTRPTLQQLRDRTRADIVTRLPGSDPSLRRSLLGVLADALAGLAHGIYGFHIWLARQLFAVTADTEYLDRHGAEYGIARKAATFAVGSVDFTGTDSTVIPAGTLVQRGDGVQYATDAVATIAAGVATVAVTAVAAGVAGNAAAATAVSLVSPIAGINSAAVVSASGLAGGVDTESIEDFRARVLARKRNTPMGGAVHDYERWALEVAGVTRVFVADAGLGAGTVVVRFVCDDNPVSIFPDAAKIAEVENYILDPDRKPAGAKLYVFAPNKVTVDIDVRLTPDTQATRDAVTAELVDLFRRESNPGQVLYLTHIAEAISTAAGEVDHDLLAPTQDVGVSAADLPVLGVITWT